MLHADSAELSTGQTQVKPPSQQIPALPSSDALTILVAARCYIKMDTVVAVACLHILFVIPGGELNLCWMSKSVRVCGVYSASCGRGSADCLSTTLAKGIHASDSQ